MKLKKLKQVWQKKPKEEEDNSEQEAYDDSSSDSENEKAAEQRKTNGDAKSKWTNRERVLVFCARGSDFRTRHLMNNFKAMLPHAKGESKLDKAASLTIANEIAEMKNCSKVLYFETRKHKDVYLWMSNVDGGPSVKFLVHNIHTLEELKMSGNCLKASRPVLSFSSSFNSRPHLALLKALFTQTFATPNFHPRSQPFIDHVFLFSVTPDGKIWFRNFQIVDDSLQLQEIGPRMVLETIRIFAGSFEGAVLYDNPNYESPNAIRAALKKKLANKYEDRQLTQLGQKEKRRRIEETEREDVVGEVFNTDREIEEPEALKLARKIDGLKAKKRREKLKQKKKDERAMKEEVDD